MTLSFTPAETHETMDTDLKLSPDEFTQEFLDLSSGLKHHALRLTKNDTDAEDLLSDTYMQALQNLNKFKAGSNLKAWLFTIMRNIFINNCRRAGLAQKVYDSPHLQQDIMPRHPSTKDPNSFTADDFQDEVLEALQGVSSKLIPPFMLVHMADYSYQEAATELGIPPGTVMSRIHRTRKALKQALSALGDPQLEYGISAK